MKNIDSTVKPTDDFYQFVDGKWITAVGGHPQQEFKVLQGEEFHFDEHFDAIFSNAALHWVPDHAALYPRLLARVPSPQHRCR